MEEFVQQLLQDQGVPQDLDPEVRTELASELTNRLSDFLNRRLIDAMSDEAVDEFNNLLDDESADPARVQEFVANHVPNQQQVTTAALREFRQLYLGDKA